MHRRSWQGRTLSRRSGVSDLEAMTRVWKRWSFAMGHTEVNEAWIQPLGDDFLAALAATRAAAG